MSSRTEEYNGEGGSLAEVAGVAMLAWAMPKLVPGKNIGMAGAVVAGVAALAWVRHNLLSAEDIAMAGAWAVVAGVAMLAWAMPKLVSRKNIGMAGAVVAGVAVLAWGRHNLLSAEDIAMAGAVVAGVAVLAWGRHNLLSAEDIAMAGAGAVVAGVAMLASGIYQLVSGKYTLHYSGSDINQLQIGGAGCIIRNKQGKLVVAATYNLNRLCPDQYNIAVAEAIAWSKGLKLAKTNRLKLDRVIGDNVEVIDRVRGLEKRAPRVHLLSEIVCDIRVALKEHSIDPMTQVDRIRREDNKVANELASLGSKLGGNYKERSYTTYDDLPSKLAQFIREDEINFEGKNLLV